MAMLEVEGLSKRFGGLLANNDISFNVDEGTILGVITNNSDELPTQEFLDLGLPDMPQDFLDRSKEALGAAWMADPHSGRPGHAPDP